jgi:hypothetical protein
MKAYYLVLCLPWFNATNPGIDWIKGQLTALQTPNGPQEVKIPEPDRASPLPERSDDNTNYETPPDIQLLTATAISHLLGSEEVVEEFAIQLGEWQWLLRAFLEDITKGEGNLRMLNGRAGAAVVVVAEW